MVYKSFHINCIVRILLIILNLYVFFYLCFRTNFYATIVITGVFPIFQIFGLFHYINKTNRFLVRAFESIQYDNFSEKIKTPLEDSFFRELCDELNQIIEKFKKNRIEKEQQFQYLKAIIDQTGMGLISIKQTGEISLMNKAARVILKIPQFKHIKQLEAVNKELSDLLIKMKTGEKENFDYSDNGISAQFAVYSSDISLKNEHYKLFTIQNIQKELEEKEMDAWKKLIRVLSHEIMNSITPISSLAATANLLIIKKEKMSPSDAEDLCQALYTIEKRSQGLIQFVQNYRRFARIPDPNFQILSVAALFKRIENLTQNQLRQDSVQFRMSVKPDNLQIKADPDLIEQVLLNLMTNAIEALNETDKPKIQLIAEMNEKPNMVISVTDNGCGIEQAVLSKVFIPFFTTKPDGSGIGLSLSRQIMRLHGGTIRIESEPGVQTMSLLVF